MHNYLNLVLHVDSEQVKNWTTLDVLSRWKLIMLLSKINHATHNNSCRSSGWYILPSHGSNIIK
jgi:hypothetical protein